MKSIKIMTRPIQGFTAVCIGREGWLVESPLSTRRIVPWTEFVLTYAPHGKIAKAAIESAASSLGIDLEKIAEPLEVTTDPDFDVKPAIAAPAQAR